MSEEEEASDEEDGSSDTDTVVQRATDHEKVTGMIHNILKLENVEIYHGSETTVNTWRRWEATTSFGETGQQSTKEPGYEKQN